MDKRHHGTVYPGSHIPVTEFQVYGEKYELAVQAISQDELQCATGCKLAFISSCLASSFGQNTSRDEEEM